MRFGERTRYKKLVDNISLDEPLTLTKVLHIK
jgi:hypothetical protein